MPSPGRAGDTDRRSSTSSTIRSTRSRFASVVGTSAARIWRCASARTCQICQVERRSSIAASTRPLPRPASRIQLHAVDGRMAERLAAPWLGRRLGRRAPRRLGRTRCRVARRGCGVRVWLPGFPGWPAGPAAALPPAWVAGRECSEIGGQDAPLGLDRGATNRPAGVQSRVDL